MNYLQLKKDYNWALLHFQGPVPEETRLTRSEFGSHIWKCLLNTIKELEERVEDLEKRLESNGS